ncbi:NrtA/SsuA/CpmA family ABC transporter substrate-binding protein [Amycolatopsis thermoflava]|uniref:NrtA/SsuA/CpmA family ABC transporter substrate-binding protein n=1 Tax=Amycolatopsis thermoflava TaxID=84480 RepID=UPI003EBC3AF8
MKRRLILAATAVLALVSACSPAPTGTTTSSADTGVLRIGPLATLNLLTLNQADGGLAKEVEAAGGSVQWSPPFAAFAPAAQALTAGQIDLTSGSTTSLVTALEANPDLVAFAVEENDNDTQGIVAAPGKNITTLADLVGKTVAVNKGGTGEYLLLQALASAGVPADAVTRTYLSPQDAATAFSSGQVDAWATWDQYLAAAKTTEGAKVVALAKDVGAVNRTIHVVSRAFLTAHPAQVAAVYRALQAEAAKAAADPDYLAGAYRAKGASDAVAAAIKAVRPPRIVPADATIQAEFAQVARFYQTSGLAPGLVDTSRSTVDATTLR